MFTNIFLAVESFIFKIMRDRVYNYSASSAFFLILSIFPFLILILTVVRYTPLTKEFLLGRLEYFLPSPIYPLIEEIIGELYASTYGAALISISAIGGLWSASKGVMSMIRGVNVCYNIEDRRQWIHVRLLSCLYTLVSLVFLIATLIILVFGSSIYKSLVSEIGTESVLIQIILFILRQRIIIGIIVLTFLFMLVYKFFPAKKNRFILTFPGAILAAGAWTGLSEILSLYVQAVPNFTYTYGSLTSFIVLMLYLYFGMYIVFACAEINFFIKSAMEKAADKRKRNKAIKYDETVHKKQEKHQKSCR